MRFDLIFEPDENDEYLKARPFFKPGKFLSFAGRATRLTEKHEKGKHPELEGGRSRAERAEIKLAAKVEQAHAKAVKLSGNRFIVKNRDGHPRGAFPALPPASARADECSGHVFDRLEGRIVYSSREEPSADIAFDDGEAEDWEMDW